MANERVPIPISTSTQGPSNPRGPSIQNLDRERRDPDSRGDSSPSKQEQGNSPNRSINGERGSREGEGGSLESLSGVAGGTASPPFTATDNILKIIGDRWNEARDLNKAGAFRQLQRDLMSASSIICPGLIPYKDLIQIVTDLEKEIKGSSSQVGKSNEELLADFLSGGSDIPIPNNPEPATLPEGESV